MRLPIYIFLNLLVFLFVLLNSPLYSQVKEDYYKQLKTQKDQYERHREQQNQRYDQFIEQTQKEFNQYIEERKKEHSRYLDDLYRVKQNIVSEGNNKEDVEWIEAEIEFEKNVQKTITSENLHDEDAIQITFKETISENKITHNSGIAEKFPDLFPIKAFNYRISSAFGMRLHPIRKRHVHHNGIDIIIPTGTEIKACASGRVVRVQTIKNGYGNNIIIKHEGGYSTLYAHLDFISVSKDQYVTKGEIIGISGNTGLSTGPHLHFEIRKNEVPVDPLLYINIKK